MKKVRTGYKSQGGLAETICGLVRRNLQVTIHHGYGSDDSIIYTVKTFWDLKVVTTGDANGSKDLERKLRKVLKKLSKKS